MNKTYTSPAYENMLEQLREIGALDEILGLLSWDEETMMPAGALESRSQQKAALAGIAHEKFTDPKLGELLSQVEADFQKSSADDPVTLANLREFRRAYNRATKVPKNLVKEMQLAETAAHAAWVTARKDNDFGLFAPHLKTLLDLRRRESQAIDDKRPPYDVQLEKYEVGLSANTIAPLFDNLKKGLVPLIQKISEAKHRPDTSSLSGTFPREKQEILIREIVTAMGFDFERGRLDVSVHPFCGGAGFNDVRMTTRFSEEEFWSALSGAMHETGHALYEQGLDKNHLHEPVCAARSMAVHESQSLLWEKHVGLSRDFWEHFFPKAQKVFAPELSGVSLDTFYFAINEVKPSLIRVDADEVTYPLHVILRFELEAALFADQAMVAQLPQLWNEKMQSYLGIVPPTDTEGVLQDVHWSLGLFGYFPTYNLGAIYASQLFKTAQQQMPELAQGLRRGHLTDLKTWLNREVHERGSLYETERLITKITGESINSNIHLARLEKKYGELYRI